MTMMATDLAAGALDLFLNGRIASASNPIYTWAIAQSATTQNYNHIALHTGNPGDDCSANEVTVAGYNSYARAAVRRSRSSTPITTDVWVQHPTNLYFYNNEQISFNPCDVTGGAILTHWSMFSASTGGSGCFYGPLFDSTSTEWQLGMATDTAAGLIYAQAHGFANNEQILLLAPYDGGPSTSFGLPAGFTAGTSYYVIPNTADTLYLSAAAGPGAAVVPTTTGPMLMARTAPLTVTVGSIPTIPVGGIRIYCT